MKKIGIIISLLLVLIGFTSFIGGALIATGIVEYNKELPLGDIEGIVIDKEGYIYVGLAFYGKVQVYDTNGEFVKNWKAGASGGIFNIDLTKNQNILISTARGNKQILYDQNGKVVSKKSIDNIYSGTKISWDCFVTNTGEMYEVKGGMFPSIIRTIPGNKVIVKQGFILQLMKGPFPAWLIGFLGIVLSLLLLGQDKIKELMTKYTAYNRAFLTEIGKILNKDF